jgi:nucleotide-binding universal stress UspA family protein
LRTVDALIARLKRFGSSADVHVLNVQHPAHGDVSAFVPNAEIADYHREEGMRALAPIRDCLQQAGIAHHLHIGVGEPSDVIAHYAREIKADEVVLGAPGARPLPGSTLRSLLPQLEVPVTLMR